MSNFVCPHCGMTNIDCGKDVFKTPREIELENALNEIEEFCITYSDNRDCYEAVYKQILRMIKDSKRRNK